MKHQQIEQQQARRKTLRIVGIGVAAVAGIVLLVWIASSLTSSDDSPEPVVPVVETTPAAAEE